MNLITRKQIILTDIVWLLAVMMTVTWERPQGESSTSGKNVRNDPKMTCLSELFYKSVDAILDSSPHLII